MDVRPDNIEDSDINTANSTVPSSALRPPVSNQPTINTDARSVVEVAATNSIGTLILQWLTYAFWGWTLVALYWLTGFSISFLFTKDSESESLAAYSLAAASVLFIVALICDIMYSYKEPADKTRGASVIMAIHAVFFALAGIGSVIVAVFAMINMVIGSEGSNGAKTALITGCIMAILYGITFLRTLRPKAISKITLIYWIIMTVATIAIACVGIFGPVAYARQTKTDRLIEANLGSVSSEINHYAEENRQLPTSLSQLRFNSYDSQAQQLVDQKIVRYTLKNELQNIQSNNDKLDSTSSYNLSLQLPQNNKVFHYVLCVTYKAKNSQNNSSYSYNPALQNGQYPTSPDTYSHKAGEVCYDLQTDYRSY